MQIVYILKDALETGFIWALLALGVFISYRVLDFADLTVEGSLTLGGAITAAMLLSGNSFFSHPIIAILMALLGGMMAGAVTGFLHTKFKIPGILAGIISMTALFSINLLVMGKASLYIGSQPTIYNFLDQLLVNTFNITDMQIVKFVSKTVTSLFVVGIVMLLMYYFFGTEIGMAIRATGCNQMMSRAQGINTNRMIILGLAISNGIVAIAGALYVECFKSANMDLGRGSIVVGLASIIIGEVLIGKTTFKRLLFAVVIGTILFQIIIGVAIALGFSANNLKLLQAILIAFILAFPVIKPLIIKWFRKRGVRHA